jgi:hypothetical protein
VTGAQWGGGRRPLSLPEQVLLASDRAEMPIIIALLGRTDGHLDADRLAAATTTVFARHPATRSELRDRAGSGGWRILPEPRSAPVAETAAATLDDAWRALRRLMLQGIDLGRAPLARLLVVHHPDGDWLGIIGHHLAIDGRSLLALLTETMAAYRPPPADEPVPAGTGGVIPAYRPAVGVRRAVRALAVRRVTPGSRFLDPAGPPGVGGFALVPRVIPAPRPARLPNGHLPTVNDVLIAAAHLAAGRWNARRGQASGTLRVRVSVGATAPGELDGLSNGFAIIRSDAAVRAAPSRLLGTVADGATAAKARASAPPGAARRLAALRATAMPARLRAAVLRLAVSALRPALMPTAAVSNLGHVPTDLTVGPGGPRLLDLHLTAPARMPQGLAIHVVRMAGRAHLTFCCASELFDDALAREFVGLFLAAVAELVEPAVPAPAAATAGAVR